jgi:ubiquinone/menaquinone biosynthesis C-methylase UbiE
MSRKKEDASLLDQFHCPTGVAGRTVAASMNKHHNLLSTWGLKHVKIEPNFTILDVGCGGGRTLGKLANQAVAGRVFGIDYSKDMITFSLQENRKLVEEGRIQLVEGSVERLSFLDDFFDLVTAFETYYFWPNLPEAFTEIKRVLKPSGTLLIVSEMIKDGAYEVENAQTIAKAQVNLFSMQEIERLLSSSGFTEVKSFRKTPSPWNVILAKKQ